MIKDIFRITIYFTVIISLMLIWSCQDDSPPSIYNENETYKPDPVITSISPDSAFAGVDTLNISGENFSTNHDDITVFFNGQKGVVVSSTLNQV
ncbi:MAG: IPT/TIG domain-containing protein, partial [Melioribacteraceae bacterium]|nr:IPT/TIG domain-containing protein [Melioribacteraceae bacterium]